MIEKLLLDTTYLLPLFGIEVDKFSKSDLEVLLDSGIDLYYNPISLIEIKWVLIKISRRKKEEFNKLREIYSETVDYLISSDDIKPTILLDGRINKLDDILFDAGMSDYFDRIITATAKVYTGTLLTEDFEIIKIVKSLREFSDLEIINWSKLSSLIR